MSHTIYQTEGLVLKSHTIGEANAVISLFTKDFGLVRVQAQGIREAKSKLRYSLQPYGWSTIDMVRGHNRWKITNASSLVSWGGLMSKLPLLRVLARGLNLVERLVQGEEENQALYTDLKQLFLFAENFNWNEKDLKAFETVFVARILHHLGYWPESDDLLSIVEKEVSDELLEYVTSCNGVLVRQINEALAETQL